MALYYYRGFFKDGKKATGSVDAPSIQVAREQLNRQGIFPTTITAEPEGGSGKWWKRLLSRGVSLNEKILFTKQLSILLKSGVQLLQALELLLDHFSPGFNAILTGVKDDIKEGNALAKSLKKYPAVFDTIYVQLVRAGEASGKLDLVLERLVENMEQQQELASRISKAVLPLIMQLGFAFAVVAFLLAYAVPQMAETFSSFDRELPLPTRILMAISNAVLSHYLVLGITIALACAAFVYWRSTSQGARAFDQFILRVPLIGYFARMNAVVQFSRTLGILFESGVSLPESLDIVVNIVDNKVLSTELAQARDKIIKQGKISQYLKQTGMFPPIAIYLIKTGEESGRLDVMLLTIADTYQKELAEEYDRVTALLGPVMLVVMALLVGFIVISMMLPVVQMGDLVNT